MVFLYVTCKDKDEAVRIGRTVVERKLAVCANIFPIDSIYPWEGKIAEDSEIVLLLKTDEALVRSAEEAILEMHSYDTPFVGTLELSRVNPGYEEFMSKYLS